MSNTTEVSGITYTKPEVILLQETGIGAAEHAARTCYDSFELSENEGVKNLNRVLNDKSIDDTPAKDILIKDYIEQLNEVEDSDLLKDLAWTYFHHSILEHANLTYLVKGTSRGVLQEHARHRIQAISVRSTRYTMSGVLNAFAASLHTEKSRDWFIKTLEDFDMLVTSSKEYNRIEIGSIWDKLNYQKDILGYEDFIQAAIAKSSIEILENKDADIIFELLQEGKKKRNVGDAFKHIVTDNFKVDMVVTFNLRSLKNYFSLRDSGAAFFQIRDLAQAMKNVTPQKYLDLIIKK